MNLNIVRHGMAGFMVVTAIQGRCSEQTEEHEEQGIEQGLRGWRRLTAELALLVVAGKRRLTLGCTAANPQYLPGRHRTNRAAEAVQVKGYT